MWFLIAWDNWALLLLVRWARTWRHVRNPMHMNMHAHMQTGEAHFHSTYALGKFPLYTHNLQLSCWGEDKLLARTHCHCTNSVTRHTQPQSFTERGLSLGVVDGTNHDYLSVGGLMALSLSVAPLWYPVGVLIPKPDQFDLQTLSPTCLYIWNNVDLIWS